MAHGERPLSGGRAALRGVEAEAASYAAHLGVGEAVVKVE